ncbi:MAG: hydroxyacylglutathione hydrolase [bacterium]
MRVLPIPAFDDNYIWLLKGDGNECAVVDPGDEVPVISRLEMEGLELCTILITHKHGDHVGGIESLKNRWPNARVYGPAKEPIPLLDEPLHEGEEVLVQGPDVFLKVLEVPGHTEGHIAYYGEGALFCGDTVFAAGCGRVFSGTFEQLSESLQRVAKLPGDTKIYCAHEYTLDNIGFAKWVEPDNEDLLAREAADQELRAWDKPTVPSTLATELATNPFLRVDQPAVIAQAQRRVGPECRSPAAVFRAIREWKDREYD